MWLDELLLLSRIEKVSTLPTWLLLLTTVTTLAEASLLVRIPRVELPAQLPHHVIHHVCL